jgi:predicted Rossmann fold flavoprotein
VTINGAVLDADVAVIGAGPSGLMAAVHAASSGARVTLLEKLAQPGVKLLSTGGGRCNLTNSDAPDVFAAHFGRRGRFMQNALGRFGPDGLRAFLAQVGVATHAPDGHLVYPVSESARTVRDALAAHCDSRGVQMRCGAPVEELVVDGGTLVGVRTTAATIRARRVIVACGGSAHPEMGSAGDGFALARRVGHDIVEPVPALVPITITEEYFSECAGISLDRVALSAGAAAGGRTTEIGDLLFTHHGISGPAALNLSGTVARLVADAGSAKLHLDVSPGTSADEWSRRMDAWRQSDGSTMLRKLLSRHFPAKVALTIVTLACESVDAAANRLSRDERRGVARAITAFELTATGTEGFARAMATSGGVRLEEVDMRTLESRIVRGLYFAGEVLDLDGPCGGYNLQWAFSSGALAGSSASAG